MHKGRNTARKVWIKTYLRTALGLKQHQLYRLLEGNYSAANLARYLVKHGYVKPVDRRTRAFKSAEQQPTLAPEDETLC
jgi:hypothetical protein